MNILDIAPLLSLIIGVLLGSFILFSKSGLGKENALRYILASLVFIYTFMALDYYLVIDSKGFTPYFGISGLFNHLTGFLFYFFIVRYTKSPVSLKPWIYGLGIYTVVRLLVSLPLLEFEDLKSLIAYSEQSGYKYILFLEFMLTGLLNIAMLILAYLKLKQAPTVVQVSDTLKLKYNWLHYVLIGYAVLETGIFVNNTIGSFTLEGYTHVMKIDTLFIVLFFFVLVFSIMQFPVFAFTGDFEDLEEKVKKKYVKSSLKDSSDLFNEIETLVKTEKLYLEYDLKLNALAEKLDKSVHHVSQAINQKAGMSFPDYINQFRIEEAKLKLIEPKPDTIYTISLDVGFSSKAAFYTAFKKFTQQTPTAYKKAHKTE